MQLWSSDMSTALSLRRKIGRYCWTGHINLGKKGANLNMPDWCLAPSKWLTDRGRQMADQGEPEKWRGRVWNPKEAFLLPFMISPGLPDTCELGLKQMLVIGTPRRVNKSSWSWVWGSQADWIKGGDESLGKRTKSVTAGYGQLSQNFQ